MRIDHDRSTLTSGGIEAEIGQKSVIAAAVSETKRVTFSRAKPAQPDKFAAFRLVRQLWAQHGG
jgi:hypothetical protein